MIEQQMPDSLRIHQFVGLAPGPRLIVLGAVHGNETCGSEAIRRVIDAIDQGHLVIERGVLTLVPVTNPMAYRLGRRQGDRNLNRNLRITTEPADFEDRVANALCPLLDAHDVLLDLHSFQSPGQPFAMLGPRDNDGALEPFGQARAEERLLQHLGPARAVEGWMQAYARGVERRRLRGWGPPMLADLGYGVGTSEYMRAHGGYAVTLECGQHADPKAPAVAEHAIRQTLALLGLVDQPLAVPASAFEVLRLVDVVDREHADDRFVRVWASFDPVTAGEIIAERANGQPVLAPSDGFVVFPNTLSAPGNEWFYFAVRSDRRLA
jgi:predicted deacylase